MFKSVLAPEGGVREEISQVNKVGLQALEFVYNSGRRDVVNSIIWSTRREVSTSDEPNAGYVNFFQSGGVSGSGIFGHYVCTKTPLMFQGVSFDNIDLLTQHLLTNFNS